MKFLKILTKLALFALLLILLFSISIAVYCFSLTKNARLSAEKLELSTQKIVFCDAFGAEIQSNYLKGEEGVAEESLTKALKDAFVSIEDKRFYKHRGIDVRRIFGAAINNLKSGSYKEGASTISQQLIKNTHLNSEKTLKRKLTEMKLALLLEKKYTKNEILTMYLNKIYFGENCYGVRSASLRYFEKEPENLTVSECATLAAIVKAPKTYSPITNPEKCKARRNLVLSEMLSQGYIDEQTCETAKAEPLSVCKESAAFGKDYLKEALSEANEILPFPLLSYGNEITVYTGLEAEKQRVLEDLSFEMPENAHFSSMVINNESGLISAFRSTVGQAARQVGSTLKPFAVYGPALENDFIDETSLILDSPVSYSGYEPKNYGDKYHGYVSAKYALSHSLNVPAVKILDGIGVNKARATLQKLNFPVTTEDNSLPLALGATQKGISLKTVCSAYSALANEGNFTENTFISKICADGKPIYTKKHSKTRAFSEETAFLLTDMLNNATTEGTARKLSHLPFPLAAKTGTVGTEKGNTDAYTVSYGKEYVLGVWLGAKEGEMDNGVSGGALPAAISLEFWKDLAKNGFSATLPQAPKGITQVAISKSAYESERKELLCPKDTEEAKKLYAYYKASRVPTETESVKTRPKAQFLSTKTDLFNVCIVLCLKENGIFNLFRMEDNAKSPTEAVYLCTFENIGNHTFTDESTTPGKTYRYVIAPQNTETEADTGQHKNTDALRCEKTESNDKFADFFGKDAVFSPPIYIPYSFY